MPTRAMALPVISTPAQGDHVPDREMDAETNHQLTVPQLTAGMVRLREDAWAEFHERYFDRLLRYATRLHHGHHASAQDSVQAGFVRAVRHIRRFDSEEVFWSWLTLLVRCAAADQGRKISAGSRLQQTLANEAQWFAETSSEVTKSRFILLEEVLEKLDPADRNLLEAKYIEGHQTAALAERGQTTIKAIENRLRHLRKQLKAQLNALAKHTSA